MIIIADTSPINDLILIDAIDTLKELFGRVIIPQAVFDELQREKTPREVKAWMTIRPEWLTVRQASRSHLSLQKRLGDGEREAIMLAIELKADAVLMDDRDGTREARRNHITVFGTLVLLDRAAERNLLNLPAALSRLAQTTFRFPAAEVIAEMLERDTQRKQARGE
jgi:predicted nucleic acid-binding protein